VLLRRTIAALVSAGHRASLLAPAAPAAALVGPAEVAEAFPWDGPEMAAVLAGETTGGPVESAIASADAVIAFTRSASVLDCLAQRARRLVARHPAPPPRGPHASVWLAGALEDLGIATIPEPQPLVFTEPEKEAAEEATSALPPGFLAVHPGSGSPAKNWPFDRFVETARRLSLGRPWLLVLGPAEDALVASPAESDAVAPPGAPAAHSPPVLARNPPLRHLGAVLERAGLFLGNDSGIAHLAAACGTRTLAVFGPTDPAQWSPVGRHVRALRAPTGRMDDLSVDEVVAAAGRRGC
jgi:ADP-heptose:LPS heptosyltransferase